MSNGVKKNFFNKILDMYPDNTNYRQCPICRATKLHI